MKITKNVGALDRVIRGWANFKHDNIMQAVFMTPAVAKKLEEACFKKIDAGVLIITRTGFMQV